MEVRLTCLFFSFKLQCNEIMIAIFICLPSLYQLLILSMDQLVALKLRLSMTVNDLSVIFQRAKVD